MRYTCLSGLLCIVQLLLLLLLLGRIKLVEYALSSRLGHGPLDSRPSNACCWRRHCCVSLGDRRAVTWLQALRRLRSYTATARSHLSARGMRIENGQHWKSMGSSLSLLTTVANGTALGSIMYGLFERPSVHKVVCGGGLRHLRNKCSHLNTPWWFTRCCNVNGT